ncbi:MAG TPA: B12-binding domain-containing radical SAM protein [Spirochaetota bacterium]|nr:B12-binding domain-containing radical SAM protein [Spirochaetota bacterium]
MIRRGAPSGNKKIMSILYVQLPLIDHGYNYIQGNVPYAPAAIAAYVRRNHPGRVAIEHLPFVIANLCSDRVITRYIGNTAPDVLCFSCYLWNVERNVEIAGIIRTMLPELTVLMGGPEIREGSWALSERRDAVDYFVAGEGEWFFDRFFSGNGNGIEKYIKDVNGNRLVRQPDTELVDIIKAPEPFTGCELDTMTDGSVFMEMTRGCPYRCSYCFYSGNCPGVREREFGVLLDALDKNGRIDLSEIYILSPTFNRMPDFRARLRTLAGRNNGVRLHTEMRSEDIDDETAMLLHAAGFRSLEVGIQTLTPGALKRIGRSGSVQRAMQGMKSLAFAGIDLKIGVIPGLPGDNPARFLEGVQTLVDKGFGESIELYPLMMLPGTRIREEGTREGAVFQKKPPYYLVDGWGFDFSDITAIRRDLEAMTGYSHQTMRIPDFSEAEGGLFCRGVRFDGSVAGAWDGARYADLIESAVFGFNVYCDTGIKAMPALVSLFEALPMRHQFYNVVFFSEEPQDERGIGEFLRHIDGDYPNRRMRVFDEWREGSQIMFYQVFRGERRFREALGRYRIIDPILRIDANGGGAPAAVAQLPGAAILVARGALDAIGDEILEHWADRIENMAFESEEEAARYYRRAGCEFLKWPFNFGVKDMR